MRILGEPCAVRGKQIIAHHFISIPAAINFTRRRSYSVSHWIHFSRLVGVHVSFFIRRLSCCFSLLHPLTSSSWIFCLPSEWVDAGGGRREVVRCVLSSTILIDYHLIDRFDTTGSLFLVLFLSSFRSCLVSSALACLFSFLGGLNSHFFYLVPGMSTVRLFLIESMWLGWPICLFLSPLSFRHYPPESHGRKNYWELNAAIDGGRLRERTPQSRNWYRNLPFRFDRNAFHPQFPESEWWRRQLLQHTITQPHIQKGALTFW